MRACGRARILQIFPRRKQTTAEGSTTRLPLGWHCIDIWPSELLKQCNPQPARFGGLQLAQASHWARRWRLDLVRLGEEDEVADNAQLRDHKNS